MSLVSIPMPEDLEQILKAVLERDPNRGQNGSGLGLKHAWPSSISSGRHYRFLRPDSPNC